MISLVFSKSREFRLLANLGCGWHHHFARWFDPFPVMGGLSALFYPLYFYIYIYIKKCIALNRSRHWWAVASCTYLKREVPHTVDRQVLPCCFWSFSPNFMILNFTEIISDIYIYGDGLLLFLPCFNPHYIYIYQFQRWFMTIHSLSVIFTRHSILINFMLGNLRSTVGLPAEGALKDECDLAHSLLWSWGSPIKTGALNDDGHIMDVLFPLVCWLIEGCAYPL